MSATTTTPVRMTVFPRRRIRTSGPISTHKATSNIAPNREVPTARGYVQVFASLQAVARSPLSFGTAQARSLFEPTLDEPNGDADAEAAEQGDNAFSSASFTKKRRERRKVTWVTLVSGVPTKEDIYSIV